MKLKGVKLEHLDQVSAALIESLGDNKEGSVVYLSGDLGAGKTTFVKSVAKLLGVTDSVQSPTFVFMREYKTKDKSFKNLYHVDAYRFEQKEDGSILKLDSLKKKGNLVIIEWPEKMHSPEASIALHIKHKNENERDIEIKDNAKKK